MSSTQAFMPRGNNRTVNGAAGVAASTINTAANSTTTAQGANDEDYLLTNVGPNVVFIEFSLALPVVATPATVANSVPLLPNSQVIMKGPPNAQISCIAAVAGNTLYASMGEGL